MHTDAADALASGERPSNPSVFRWSTPRGRKRRVSASPRSWRSLSESGGSCSSEKYAPLPERGCSASCGFATAKLTTASERESDTRSSRIETPACLMQTIARAAAICCAADSDAHSGSSRSPVERSEWSEESCERTSSAANALTKNQHARVNHAGVLGETYCRLLPGNQRRRRPVRPASPRSAIAPGAGVV